MTTGIPPGGDEDVLASFAEVARARRPSRFETARAARDLEGALDRLEERRRRALRPAVAAAAVVVAGAVGVVTGVELGSAARTEPMAVAPAPAPVLPAAVAPVAGLATPPQLAPAGTEVVHVAPAPALAVPVAAPALPPLRRPQGWPDVVAALREAGDHAGAARALVAALLTDDAAAGPLLVALRQAPAAFDDVDAALAAVARAEPMRVRCEAGLLYRRQRATLEACRAFAQQWPEHPGARVLAFAAGRLAEDELGDLEAAEAEFGRAILLAPLAGMPSTDALLARARVRAALGVLDEARGDLRLYLHQEPAAASEPSVRALIERLGLAP